MRKDYARYWQYAAVPLFVSFARSDRQDGGHRQFELERLDSDTSIFGQFVMLDLTLMWSWNPVVTFDAGIYARVWIKSILASSGSVESWPYRSLDPAGVLSSVSNNRCTHSNFLPMRTYLWKGYTKFRGVIWYSLRYFWSAYCFCCFCVSVFSSGYITYFMQLYTFFTSDAATGARLSLRFIRYNNSL